MRAVKSLQAPKFVPWDSHGYKSLDALKIRKHLDLPLKSSNWESLDNCPSWLCLHLDLFAKCHPCASFCGWLCPGLDAAKAWKGKDTRLLHFLGLQAMLRSNVLYHGTLCQLVAAGSLHGTWSLHCLLHRSHGDATSSEENRQAKTRAWVCLL